MVPQGLVAGIAKVAVTGGLMAAAAGGIYVVASTRGDETPTQLIADVTGTIDAGTPPPDASATADPNATATVDSTGTPTTPTAVTIATTPTPPSPSQAMLFGGTIWLDGRPAEGAVLAFIDGRECGQAQAGAPPSNPPGMFPFFAIQVASSTQQAGCGIPGALVSFTIDGRALPETVAWQPGTQASLVWFADPVFSLYYGTILFDDTDAAKRRIVVPFIDGAICGEQIRGTWFERNQWTYDVSVRSAAQQPGCGVDGVSISLRLQTDREPDVDLATVSWQPGLPVTVPTVDLRGRTDPTP